MEIELRNIIERAYAADPARTASELRYLSACHGKDALIQSPEEYQQLANGLEIDRQFAARAAAPK